MSGPGVSGVGLAQRLTAIFCMVLLGVQVVRSAAVTALAEPMPETAARLWPGHPDVQVQSAMVAIARATGQQQPIPQAAFDAVADGARKAPLSPAPFLVRGVQAQVAGDAAVARAAFLAAVRRDPRSLPARYFLADQDLRSGDVAHGLKEIAVLAVLTPGGAQGVAPFVASFAREERNRPAVRALFARNPDIASATLSMLATDAANADTILALTDPSSRGPDSAWAPGLLQSLVDAGRYAKAQALWASLSGLRLAPDALLYDASFTDPLPPPPFNWALTSSPVGLAERQPGGRLHAIFYGQQDGPLARQLLLLAPGRYNLTMRVTGLGGRAGALSWSLTCAKASAPLATIDLAAAESAPWTFSVPASCPAQWLALSGTASDVSRQADVTISGLRLSRAGGNG